MHADDLAQAVLPRPEATRPDRAHAPWRRRAIAALTALAALGVELSARADCLGPQADILWSYPDETTASVPPDTVFWAVSHGLEIDVSVDGVPLTALGTGPIDREQFVADAPLAAGEHELAIRARVTDGSRSVLDSDERQLRFRVAAQPPVTSDVSIRSVEVYPYVFSNVNGERLSPPDNLNDPQCAERRTALEWGCNDLIPATTSLVELEGDGNAIGYLMSDGSIVPPSCTSLFMPSSNNPASYRVTAVLPTGLSDEQAFSGSLEEVTFPEVRPDLYADPREGMLCTLGSGRRSPGELGAVIGLALVACWTRRRRR